MRRKSHINANHLRQLIFGYAVSLLATIVTPHAFAQKGLLEGGVHVGCGMSSFNPAIKNQRDFYFSPIPDAGLLLNYHLGNVISLSTELNYAPVRTVRNGLLPFTATPFESRYPQNSYGYYTERIQANYIELPLMINGAIGDRFKVFCGAGGFIAFRVSARSSISGTSYIYSDSMGKISEPMATFPLQYLQDKHDIGASIRSVNFGGCGHLGIIYRLGKGNLWLDARYTFGIADIWKTQPRPGIGRTVLLAVRAAYTIQIW